MRYRSLSATGDSTFASGATNFFVNNAAAVAQAILTRLRLLTGEWFLDVTEGTPYLTQVIGRNTTPTYDRAIKDRILGTIGVLSIDTYSSFLNRAARSLTVNATVSTIFGAVPVTFTTGLSPTPPTPPSSGGVLDFSNPANSALLGGL